MFQDDEAMLIEEEELPPLVKRFRYESYAKGLKGVHAPSSLTQGASSSVDDLEENQSSFYEALQHWRQLNLSPHFLTFAKDVEPISASLPLLLHNWKDVTDIWKNAVEKSDDEGLKTLLDLMQKLTDDLRTTLCPSYDIIISALLRLLPRTLPPTTLTIVLATISSVFKHLLLPTLTQELLEATWAAIADVLPKCQSEIQRAVGEAWGGVVRRFKTELRPLIVSLMVDTLEGREDAIAWVFVSACKSVSQSLHTATTSLLKPLLAAHMERGTKETYTLLRRTFTSLCHFVKSADAYQPIGDMCVTMFTDSAVAEGDRLEKIEELLCVLFSVRGGSRMSASQRTRVVEILESPQIHTEMKNERFQAQQVKLWTALLRSGDMSLATSAGRRLLLSPAVTSQSAIHLHGVLAELGWCGYKMVGVPVLLRATPKLLDEEPIETTKLLAKLKDEGKLTEGDAVWRQKVGTWILERLKQVKLGTDNAEHVENLLKLSPHCPKKELTNALVDLVNRHTLISVDAPQRHGRNEEVLARCIGGILSTLSTHKTLEAKLDASLIFQGWYWSASILDGLVDLIENKGIATMLTRITFDAAWTLLEPQILSHRRTLRLASLRLLSSTLQDHASDGLKEVVDKCYEGEQVELDIQGVRERMLRITRVSQLVRNDDAVSGNLCIRWLIAQQKVNLRPLWTPSAEALAQLAEQHGFGDEIWTLLFSELKDSFEKSFLLPNHDEDMEDVEEDAEEEDADPWEEERTWRDPSMHKYFLVTSSWSTSKFSVPDQIRSQEKEDARFDMRSYGLHLLAAIGHFPSVAEKHNRELVTLFLSLVGSQSEKKLPRASLSAWLTVFAKFTNPKALYRSEECYGVYQELLSHADRTLQRGALDCILAYKSKALLSRGDQMKGLLDDTRWRDELTSLELAAIEGPERAEAIDVAIRILFGLMLEKKGKATKGGSHRSALLGALAGCRDHELHLLVDLMLRPIQMQHDARKEAPFRVHEIADGVTEGQQIGFLVMLTDVLRSLGGRLIEYWPALLGATIDFVAAAHHCLESKNASEERKDGDESDDDDPSEVSDPTKLTKSIRQLGIKRFTDFFRAPVDYDFIPFLPAAFSSFISPRLQTLDTENTQAPSALLELFAAWSNRHSFVYFLVQFDSRLLPKIFGCLIATNVKAPVISRVFDVIERLINMSEDDEEVKEKVLKRTVPHLFPNLATMSQKSPELLTPSTQLGQRQISLLSRLAVYCSRPVEASLLLQLLSPLLKKPNKVVNEKVKVDLLRIARDVFPLVPEMADTSSELYRKTYELVSSLFQSLRSRPARLNLVEAFQSFSVLHPTLERLASVMGSLNAFSTKRVDEPDFDRRLDAFAMVNGSIAQEMTALEWLPLLHHMLHALQDPTELSIRSSASTTLKHYIDIVSAKPSSAYELYFSTVTFPGLKNGLRSKNELVRSEILQVISHAILQCQHLPGLQDMKPLLANGDEEANFFHNIHHLQLHRRSRALRRLADLCEEHPLRNSTLVDIILPLISNFIAPSTVIDHHLATEAILTTGRLSKHLTWNAYYAMLVKYLRAARAKDEAERVNVRTVVALLDNFAFKMSDDAVEDTNVYEEGDGEEIIGFIAVDAAASAQTVRVLDAVTKRLLPSLLDFLNARDATTEDSTRIPVAIGIANVARQLPMEAGTPQITRLLTTLSQIFRSKSQETRDLTRESLCRIVVAVGPKYLPIALQELRTALTRGPHLHILAYVTQTLLVYVSTGDHAAEFAILDSCASSVAHIATEVIFGESGKDVQAEGFKTKTREVRSSSTRGLDTFGVISRYVTPSNISALLQPLKSILQQTDTLKTLQLVDETLRRITSGLNANKHLVPIELISVCHTLVTQNSQFLKEAPPRKNFKGAIKKDYAVQVKRELAVVRDHYANNSYRFIAAGLDLFNTALKRNRFDFKDRAILSRLETMVVAVGNTLYSSSAPVLVLALKCVSGLVKCPVASLERSLPIFVRQTLEIIQSAGGNTEAEVMQVALRSLSAILRDGPKQVQVKEKDLVFLLELISPDLEDAAKQNTAFTTLRAIVSRKFVVPEIYDLMERVSEVMVTSQSPQAQELCRGVLLQFLLDYPQGKGRLRTQMAFLCKNISYVHESGRKSVMELLGAVVQKFQENLIFEYADLIFISLVMALANDESTKCKEMAASVVASLLARLDGVRKVTVFAHLHSWAIQEEKPQLSRVAFQVYGIAMDTYHRDAGEYSITILQDINMTLARSSEALKQLENIDGEEDDAMDVDVEWQAPYQCLTALSKVLNATPALVIQADAVNWEAMVEHLLYPHAWVRTISCRLVGLLFGAIPVEEARRVEDLTNSTLRETAKKICQQLKSEHLTEGLGLQVVKNLFYLGKSFVLSLKDGEEDEVAGDEEGGAPPNDVSAALAWLFSTLSYQIRTTLIARRNKGSRKVTWNQPTAVLRWFAAMVSYMEPSIVERFLVHILSPVYRITEDDTIQDAEFLEVKTLATELQELVQTRVGTTKFSTVYNQIRQGIQGVRQERKESRVLLGVNDPAAAAKRKYQKNVVKKESRKRKNQTFADGRGRTKKSRDE